MGGIYPPPNHVSGAVRDLIARMLEVDPMKRTTIPQIRKHRWFQAHLPRYLAVPPPDSMQQTRKIDEEILQEVVRMGFNRNNLVDSLHQRVQTKGTVVYYLLVDNRFHVSSGYLGAEFQESMEYVFGIMPASEPAVPVFARAPSQVDYTERKWALGLQSQAHPREIITEVLKALQELNVCWKKIGHYNLKCRFVPGSPRHLEGMINAMQTTPYFGDESIIRETDSANSLQCC